MWTSRQAVCTVLTRTPGIGSIAKPLSSTVTNSVSVQNSSFEYNGLFQSTGYIEQYQSPVSDAIPECSGFTRSSSVSLNSVMQTSVPSPFLSGNRCPTHRNMPGGSIRLYDKYISNNHVAHRMYGTMPYPQGIQGKVAESNPNPDDISCPQGIQGEECTTFKLWYRNCTTYNLKNFQEEFQQIISGEKNPQEALEEQQVLLKQLQESSKDTYEISSPSAQGIQGEDDYAFNMSLDNSRTLNTTNNNQSLAELRAGSKTLTELFVEQEELLRQAVGK